METTKLMQLITNINDYIKSEKTWIDENMIYYDDAKNERLYDNKCKFVLEQISIDTRQVFRLINDYHVNDTGFDEALQKLANPEIRKNKHVKCGNKLAKYLITMS